MVVFAYARLDGSGDGSGDGGDEERLVLQPRVPVANRQLTETPELDDSADGASRASCEEDGTRQDS
jgi:hypothetical protein